jgi:hypothetical protein
MSTGEEGVGVPTGAPEVAGGGEAIVEAGTTVATGPVGPHAAAATMQAMPAATERILIRPFPHTEHAVADAQPIMTRAPAGQTPPYGLGSIRAARRATSCRRQAEPLHELAQVVGLGPELAVEHLELRRDRRVRMRRRRS